MLLDRRAQENPQASATAIALDYLIQINVALTSLSKKLLSTVDRGCYPDLQLIKMQRISDLGVLNTN